MSKILIVAEVKNGEIKKNTLELLSFAKSQGFENEAVLIGSGVAGQADILAGQGASTVYLGDDPSLEIYNTEQYTALVSDAILQSGATQVWLSSSEMGRDLTPRVAARQSVGALSDVTHLEISGDEITAYRPCMSTKVIQKCTPFMMCSRFVYIYVSVSHCLCYKSSFIFFFFIRDIIDYI